MTNTDSTWKSEAGYIWSLIGSAVGFANILSFSAQVHKNGGGAFLIPYMMALFILGVPLLILEGLIGSRLKAPLVTAYGAVFGKIGKALGWLSVFACLTIGAFYIVLTGYSISYFYFTVVDAVPEDSKTFFLHSFLRITPSLSEVGDLSLPILFSTLAVGLATWFVLSRSIKDGIEKVCTIFMPLLALIMALFAALFLFLPGGLEGLIYYLKPDFTKLLDPLLWRDVFGQLFFSLSLGLGIVVGYSRHTSQTTNIAKAMKMVALGDFAVSFVSGAAIFGCLAHISYTEKIPFEAILTTDSPFEIGFILFPKMFKFFGPVLGKMIGLLFFFCVFIAGITGFFSITESISGNFEFEFKMSRKKAVFYALSSLILLSLVFCMGNASHIIDAIAPMVMGTNMLIGGLGLILAFQFINKEFCQEKAFFTGKRMTFYGICLKFISPILLMLILIGNLSNEFQQFNLGIGLRWGWFVGVLLLAYLFQKLTEKKLLSYNIN